MVTKHPQPPHPEGGVKFKPLRAGFFVFCLLLSPNVSRDVSHLSNPEFRFLITLVAVCCFGAKRSMRITDSYVHATNDHVALTHRD